MGDRSNRSLKLMTGLVLLATVMLAPSLWAQQSGAAPLLTVKQLMNAIITPTTATIWGAYDLQTEAQWLEVENAALGVIAAGNLLALGGAGDGEVSMAATADWQRLNQDMIDAAGLVLDAVAARDEEALFSAGNDALYPPCESCHQQFQQR